jgi:hypothetical protein
LGQKGNSSTLKLSSTLPSLEIFGYREFGNLHFQTWSFESYLENTLNKGKKLTCPAHVCGSARLGLAWLTRPNFPHVCDAALSTSMCQAKPTAHQAISTVPTTCHADRSKSSKPDRCHTMSRRCRPQHAPATSFTCAPCRPAVATCVPTWFTYKSFMEPSCPAPSLRVSLCNLYLMQ